MVEVSEDVSPREFESEIADLFRQRGWYVDQQPPGRDAGVDIDMKRDGKTAGVQVKHYLNSKVQRSEVQQYAGAKAEHGYDEFYLVTSGKFTGPAKEAGQNVNVHLINGDELHSIAETTSRWSLPEIKKQSMDIALDVADPFIRDDRIRITVAVCCFLILGGFTGDSERIIGYFGIIALFLLICLRYLAE